MEQGGCSSHGARGGEQQPGQWQHRQACSCGAGGGAAPAPLLPLWSGSAGLHRPGGGWRGVTLLCGLRWGDVRHSATQSVAGPASMASVCAVDLPCTAPRSACCPACCACSWPRRTTAPRWPRCWGASTSGWHHRWACCCYRFTWLRLSLQAGLGAEPCCAMHPCLGWV